jgi:hypothetical protein
MNPNQSDENRINKCVSRSKVTMILSNVVCAMLLCGMLTHPTILAYKIEDDASWAVLSNHLSNDVLGSDRQGLYNDYMRKCRIKGGDQCDRDENHRMQMNMYQPRSVCIIYLFFSRLLILRFCSFVVVYSSAHTSTFTVVKIVIPSKLRFLLLGIDEKFYQTWI